MTATSHPSRAAAFVPSSPRTTSAASGDAGELARGPASGRAPSAWTVATAAHRLVRGGLDSPRRLAIEGDIPLERIGAIYRGEAEATYEEATRMLAVAQRRHRGRHRIFQLLADALEQEKS